MRGRSAPQRVVRLRRVEDGGNQRLLILDGKPKNLRFLYGPLRGFLRRRYDEVAQGTPWISAARRTIASASGEIRASRRVVLVDVCGMVKPHFLCSSVRDFAGQIKK